MMNVAGTMTTDDIPPEVLELIKKEETVDFGMVRPDTSDLPGGMGAAFDVMPVFLGFFAIFFVAVLCFIVFVTVRSYKASKKAGLDPFTLQTELAVRAANSQMLAPKQTREQKLAELDSLLARGVITRDEYAQARLRALTD